MKKLTVQNVARFKTKQSFRTRTSHSEAIRLSEDGKSRRQNIGSEYEQCSTTWEGFQIMASTNHRKCFV